MDGQWLRNAVCNIETPNEIRPPSHFGVFTGSQSGAPAFTRSITLVLIPHDATPRK